MTDPTMTGEEMLAAQVAALATVTFPGGHPHKRFARDIQRVAPAMLSERQRAHVARLCWRYRRQIPPHLVPPANPDPAALPPGAAAAPPAPAITPRPMAEPAAPPLCLSFIGRPSCC